MSRYETFAGSAEAHVTSEWRIGAPGGPHEIVPTELDVEIAKVCALLAIADRLDALVNAVDLMGTRP